MFRRITDASVTYTCIISMDGVARRQRLETDFLWDVKKPHKIQNLDRKGRKKSHLLLAVEKCFLGADRLFNESLRH